MRQLLILCILFIGCEEPRPYNPPGATGFTEVIEIPQAYRVKNYAGGSCAFASASCALHSQGEHELANHIRRNYSGAAYPEDIMNIIDEVGLKYSYGEGMNFLRAIHQRRLTSWVGWPRGHVVNFVGIDENYVYVLDNNYTEAYTRIPIDRFEWEWQGWAVALSEKSTPPSLVPRRN